MNQNTNSILGGCPVITGCSGTVHDGRKQLMNSDLDSSFPDVACYHSLGIVTTVFAFNGIAVLWWSLGHRHNLNSLRSSDSYLRQWSNHHGLSPGRRQAIIWDNAEILLIGPLGINFSEILIEIQTFSQQKKHLKMASAKWRLFRLGLNSFSLWPSDTIWRQKSGSTLAQVMACAWGHQAITRTNVDWSSVKSSDIHIRAISQEMPRP